MKHIALSEIKDNLPRFLSEAASEQIVITRHGHPAGILVGFATDDDWLDYRLEHDLRFLDRIGRARASIQEGRGVRLEDLDAALCQTKAPNQTDLCVRPWPCAGLFFIGWCGPVRAEGFLLSFPGVGTPGYSRSSPPANGRTAASEIRRAGLLGDVRGADPRG